jgi:AcrR family transcriptional regulator
MGRTGRRPGKQDTRELILAAARGAFAERGYDNASIRGIAAGAGVDPALVHHYFGTKDQLFLAAMQAPFDPGELVTQALSGGRDGAGERLIRTLLTTWDSAAGGPAAALIRTAVGSQAMAKLLREFIINRILRRMVRVLELDPAEGALRANLIGTQLAGLIMIRYIFRIEPLASAPQESVVALIGPTVQRYISDALPKP